MKIAEKLSRRSSIAPARDRDSGLEVVVGAPRKVDQLERQGMALRGGLHHLDRFGGDVAADAISGQDSDALRTAILRVGQIHRRSRWLL